VLALVGLVSVRDDGAVVDGFGLFCRRVSKTVL